MTVEIDGKTYRITNVEMRGHVCDKWRKIDLADPQVQQVAQKCAELFLHVNPGSGKTISFSFDMTSSGLIRKQYHVLLKQIKVDDKTHDVSDPDLPDLQLLSNTLGLPFMLWLNKHKYHPGHPAPAPLPPKPVPPTHTHWATDDDFENLFDESFIYLDPPVKPEVAGPTVEEVIEDELPETNSSLKPPTKLIPEGVNLQPCSREGNGNSCFVNTALQIIASIPPLLALFETELQPRTNESNHHFQQRKKVHETAKSLLQQLGRGEQEVGKNGGLRRFIEEINPVLESQYPHMRQSMPLINIDQGDDAAGLILYLETFFYESKNKSSLLPITTIQLKEGSLKAFIKKHQYPPVLELRRYEEASPEVPEKIDVEGTTYQLQAVYNSTGGQNRLGHATPSIRKETGDFVVIDDINGRYSQNKKQVLDHLKQPTGWKTAYYIKVKAADATVAEVLPDVLAPKINEWANQVAQPKQVGNLGKQWQFPSDHLPVGIECREARFASWNVLNKEFMQHITDNKQGLVGSMITDLHASHKRDEHVCALTKEMSSRVDLIAEQECSVPYLNHLQNNLPNSWALIRSSDQPQVIDQVALMYNKSKFHCIESETLHDTMPSAPGRPVQRVTLQDKSTGETFVVINGHIPGDNTLPARQEFAHFVKKSSRSNATTVVLGDNNFLRNEMITAYDSAGLANYSLHSPWNTIVGNNKSSKCIDHICVHNGKARNLAPLELMPQSSNLESTVNLLN
jgi:hypothetical protein